MGSTCKESVLRNRKATLKKKASELSTLCDAEVCVVFMDANGNLEAWPEDVDKANATIIKYNNIIQSQPPSKKTKTTTRSNKAAAAADENVNLNLLEKKQILYQNRAEGKLDTTTDDDKNSHGINSMWDGNLEKLSKESLIGLSNCLDAKIQTLVHKIDQESKPNIVQLYDDDDDQITCDVGPIDEFDMNNPDLMITNNCNMVMVDKFDQLQPSIPPLATLPPLPMEFSDNATIMAASESLPNYNNIIDATWPSADYFPGVENTISIDGDGSDQYYWNNLLGALQTDSNLGSGLNFLMETDSDLGSHLNFLMEDNKEISNPFPTEDNFGLPISMWKPYEPIWEK